MKVSVVVPVYNPGPHIDPCIASLLAQTMPLGDMEAIFVDDGSTDGTGERLDALAAEHEHVTVVHIPNSGWPGRPRNLGLDRARGDHVLFVDNDDWLDPEALERLHAAALRDDADIVIPKVVGHGKGVPRELFRHNRTGATLLRDPILSLLTPHKLFRRAFLVEQGLRFPEGRRRLEDHVFVVPAYFAARAITVVSDHPLYHWVGRDDGTNASVRPLTASYFDDLREVLDLVEERTEPGAVRDRLLAHWYRSKVLARLGSARLLARPPEQRPELFDACRALALERFGPTVSARVGAPLRIRARLLTEGGLDGLEALAEAERPLDPGIRLERAAWEGDVLHLELSAAPVDGAGAPLGFRREDGRLRWELPEGVPGAERVTPEDRDVEDALGRSALRVHVRRRDGDEEYLLPVASRVHLEEDGERVTMRLTASAELDPASAVAGVAALPGGIWDVHAELLTCGLGLARRVPAGDGELPPPALLGHRARVAIPYATARGNLSVDLDETAKRLGRAVPAPRAREAGARRRDGRLAVRVPLRVRAAPGAARDATLVLRAGPGGAPASSVAARLVGTGAGAVLEADVPAQVGRGAWLLSAAVTPGKEHTLGLRLDVRADGRAAIRPVTSSGRGGVAGLAAASPLYRALRRSRALRGAARAVRDLRARRG